MRLPERMNPGTVGAATGAAMGSTFTANLSTTPDCIHSFLEAMADAGIPPHDPGEIVPDGALHRFRVEGDKAGTRNGWAILHLDGVPAGAFGSWKMGLYSSWCSRERESLTEAEREQMNRQMEAAKAKREAEREREQREAAERAGRIWREAVPANPAHPYLVEKGISPGIARQRGERLVLPVADLDGEITSLQFIGADGSKKLLAGGRKRGGCIPPKGELEASRVVIAEGWATAQTLAEGMPDSLALAAIDAGNLEAVALKARKHWPNAEIILAADNDAVGIEKAREAAQKAQGTVSIPPTPGNDWNDEAREVAHD